MKSVGKEYKAQMPLLTKPDFKPTKKKFFFVFRIQKIRNVFTRNVCLLGKAEPGFKANSHWWCAGRGLAVNHRTTQTDLSLNSLNSLSRAQAHTVYTASHKVDF